MEKNDNDENMEIAGIYGKRMGKKLNKTHAIRQNGTIRDNVGQYGIIGDNWGQHGMLWYNTNGSILDIMRQCGII